MSEINPLTTLPPQQEAANKITSKSTTQGTNKPATFAAQDAGATNQLSSSFLEHRNKIMDELRSNIRPEVIQKAKEWADDANWPSVEDLDALTTTPDLAKTLLSKDTDLEITPQD